MWPQSTDMDFCLRVKEEDAGEEFDMRLARRWKRRCNTNKNFSVNFSKKARSDSVKVEHVPVDLDEHDSHSAAFLNCFVGNYGGGSNDVDVNTRCSDGGHDNAKMEEKYDQDAEPRQNMCLVEDDVPIDVDECDEDYAVFLSGFVENNRDGDRDADVYARCLDGGCDDVRTAENDEQDADPHHDLCLIDVRSEVDEHDEDYAVFFNWVVANNCDGDKDADASPRCLDDGNDDDKIKENNDQDADPQYNACVENDDEKDPQYMMFLGNLREDGRSYVLEVVINNGVSVLIKYEGEEGLSNGLKLHSQETLRSCPRREKTETARTPSSASKIEKTESLHNLGDVSSMERTDNSGRTVRNASRRDKTEWPHVLSGGSSIQKSEQVQIAGSFGRDEKTETPIILTGVPCIEETGTGRILRSASRREKTKSPNVRSSVSFIEKTENIQAARLLRSMSLREHLQSWTILGNVSSTERTDKQRTLRNASRRDEKKGPHVLNSGLNIEKTEKTKTARTWRSASRRENTNSPNVFSDDSCMEKTEKTARLLGSISQREKAKSLNIVSDIYCTLSTGKKRNLTNVPTENLRDNMEKENESLMRDLKAGKEYPGGTNGLLRKRSGTGSSEVLPPAKRECNREVESDKTDESYREFLNCLKNDGKSLVYVPESGSPLKYEDVESSADSEEIAMDANPSSDGYCTPHLASKFASIVCITSSFNVGPSHFLVCSFKF